MRIMNSARIVQKEFISLFSQGHILSRPLSWVRSRSRRSLFIKKLLINTV